MRMILMSALFIVVVILLYMNTIGGDDGVRNQIKDSGDQINHTIERINMYGLAELP